MIMENWEYCHCHAKRVASKARGWMKNGYDLAKRLALPLPKTKCEPCTATCTAKRASPKRLLKLKTLDDGNIYSSNPITYQRKGRVLPRKSPRTKRIR